MTKHPPLRSSSGLEAAAAILVLLIAFGLRFVGLKFGFPLLAHTDEWSIVQPAVTMTANRSLDPGFYGRPDLISIYLNVVVLNVVSFLSFGHSLAATFEGNRLTYYFTARLMTAILGTALPLSAYFLARAWRRALALPAAILFAFLPSYVIHSHYATPDVPTALLTILVLLAAARYLKAGEVRWLYIGSILAAVNTAEKYPGLLSLAIVFGAIALQFAARRRSSGSPPMRLLFQRLGLACTIFAVSFCLLSPGLFLNIDKTFRDFINEARSSHIGADGLGFGGNLIYYAREFYYQVGPIVILLAAVGTYDVLRSGEPALFLAFYGFVYWIALSVLALHWERWALPMYTSPLLLAAVGFDFLRRNLRPASLRWMLVGAAGAALLGLSVSSAAYSVSMTYKDTRWAALIYSKAHDITARNSMYDSYTPFAPRNEGLGKPDYRVLTSKRYLILSSFVFDRYFNEPTRYRSEIETYNRIQEQNELVAVFEPSPPVVAFDSTPIAFESALRTTTLAQKLEALDWYLMDKLGIPTEPRYRGPRILIYRVLRHSADDGVLHAREGALLSPSVTSR